MGKLIIKKNYLFIYLFFFLFLKQYKINNLKFINIYKYTFIIIITYYYYYFLFICTFGINNSTFIK